VEINTDILDQVKSTVINTYELALHKRVLIIDDSVDMTSLLRCLLESRGYLIDTESDGEAALLSLQEGNPLPDLILLDLQMPGMGGYEFLKIQNLSPTLSKIPTIIMSAAEFFVPNLDQMTPQAILKKPLSISSVLNALTLYVPLT
jgi:CheY-like chemotaxis protein